MIWCQHLKKKITGSKKRKFLYFLFNLFNYIFRLLNQTIFALKGMILQPFEGTKHHKTQKNQLNFCCNENNQPEKACLLGHCCTLEWKVRLNFFKMYVMKRKMIILVNSIYIWSLFKAIQC